MSRWSTSRWIVLTIVTGCTAALLGLQACGDTTTPAGPTGGAVTGALDSHCAGKPAQATDPARCKFTPDMAGPKPDGGADPGPEYGDTLYNAEGDDDDCKYHVKWSASDIRQNADFTFTVTVTKKTDGSPLTGADPEAQVFLDDTHSAPDTGAAPTEIGNGVYKIGPVRVDKKGRWTVRFHLYDSCFDYIEESPHGHAAFFLDVP